MFRFRFSIAVAMLFAAGVLPTFAQSPSSNETAQQATPSDGQNAAKTGARSDVQPENDTAATPSADVEAPAPTKDVGSSTSSQQKADPAVVAEAPEKRFTVSTWGGAYGQAQKKAVAVPFGRSHDVAIEVLTDGDGKALRGDVVELNAAALDAACQSGELAKVDASLLTPAPDTADTAQQDFIADGVHDCGPASMVWSAVFAVNENALKAGTPNVLQDVFDTTRFPGRRVLIKSPRYLLEMALIADGVAPEVIYQHLSTDEGLERAFAKLDSLGKDLVWKETAKQTEEDLMNGSAVFAQTFNGQAFYAAAYGAPIRIIWDGQVYTMSFWAIPADGSSQDIAKEFVGFATAPKQLAAVAEEIAYGPARVSATALVKQHASIGLDLTPYLPTRPENMARAVPFDAAWWDENGTQIDASFATWVEEREAAMRPKPMPKPVRKPE
ncbi:exported protein of unknown function [Candidatus Filomicrobium marinum]|uniref:Spermidine/putrescine ABC transporter substrate-binding protein n=1 Tax=Candidatus Filomicrobium marinum TaxID=1608628 RepID=A0A0D6JD08_9HYPH|nr:extracellular solute-binding protein [Candidatus Filomicrobium marinum]CFX11859.1 exported protein of unknown function [Candidatus Filomicrobium marinum]CPR17347.1 exported protein of unknown function [Candidatus Filomicrobium marinum]